MTRRASSGLSSPYKDTNITRASPLLPHQIPTTSPKPSLYLPLADECEDQFSTTRLWRGHLQPEHCNNTQEWKSQCLCVKLARLLACSHQVHLGFKTLGRGACFPGLTRGFHLPLSGSSVLSAHGFWRERSRGLSKHF